MAEENNNNNSSGGVVELAKVILESETTKPAAQELGKALTTVGKLVNVALEPVSGLVWGYEKIKDFVNNKVAQKLQDVPSEEITTPPPNVAGPLLEALRYTGHDENLRELYANLLATSMQASEAKKAHPAFVEIIKQLTPDEAKIVQTIANNKIQPLIECVREIEGGSGSLRVFPKFSLIGYKSNCTYPEQTPEYLDNLARLGLIEIDLVSFYTAPGIYDELENHQFILELKASIESNPRLKFKIMRGLFKLTDLGEQFCETCL